MCKVSYIVYIYYCIISVNSLIFIGKGLGKDETGRASAIKVGVKKDTLGVCIINDIKIIITYVVSLNWPEIPTCHNQTFTPLIARAVQWRLQTCQCSSSFYPARAGVEMSFSSSG